LKLVWPLFVLVMVALAAVLDPRKLANPLHISSA
jgi:hypothetical protein